MFIRVERLTIKLISYRSIFRQQATAGGGEGGGLEPGFELEQQDDDDLWAEFKIPVPSVQDAAAAASSSPSSRPPPRPPRSRYQVRGAGDVKGFSVEDKYFKRGESLKETENDRNYCWKLMK